MTKFEGAETKFWDRIWWKRGYLIKNTAIHILLLICLLEFTFSSIFEINTLIWVGLMKVLGLIVETYLEEVLEDKLLVACLIIGQGVTEYIATFGAPDYLDVLKSFYVELCKFLLFYKLIYSRFSIDRKNLSCSFI